MRHPKDRSFCRRKAFSRPACGRPLRRLGKVDAESPALAKELGPIFDITCDCEDGAHAGAEREHAEMAANLIMRQTTCSIGSAPASTTSRIRTGGRTWRSWSALPVTACPSSRCPKPCSVGDVQVQIEALREIELNFGVDRRIPVHVLIETHGALREVWEIAALPGVESLDFGLMDFVSGHHGAIPGSAMKSPGQFDHPLIARAKCEISAAALACGVVPSHNVTTELKDIEYIGNDARRARTEFGYLRMWSIHPNQIIPIVEAMRPDFSEVQVRR
jgi:citrate lyase subunit beta/citryl-CoA lyase